MNVNCLLKRKRLPGMLRISIRGGEVGAFSSFMSSTNFWV